MTASREPQPERGDLKTVLTMAIRKPVQEDKSPSDVLLPHAEAADVSPQQKSPADIMLPESEESSESKRTKDE